MIFVRVYLILHVVISHYTVLWDNDGLVHYICCCVMNVSYKDIIQLQVSISV